MARGASRAKNARRIVSAQFDRRDIQVLDGLLGRMPIELRTRTLKRVVRLAGKTVEREAVRRLKSMSFPHQSEESEFARAEDSLTTVVRENGRFVSAFTGPVWPAGLTAHLIEYGFKQLYFKVKSGAKVKRKQPKQIASRPFLRPAADSTRQKQQAVIVSGLKRAINRLAKK